MTDFRPGDHQVVAPHDRSIMGWVFVSVGAALVAAGCGWAYLFQPEWVADVYDLAGLSRTVMPAQDDKSDSVFAALYQRYGMAPLGASMAASSKVNSLLASLQKEPCDKRAVFQASNALENLRARRS